MRRIRPRLASLVAAFDSLGLRHPDFSAVLVGVTDDRPADYLNEVPNADGFYQTTVGFDPTIGLEVEGDQQLAEALFRQLSQAILACPFAPADRLAVGAMLSAWERGHLATGGSADAVPGTSPVADGG
jgi:hypothetical protein